MKIILLLGLIIRLRRIVMIYNIANKMIKYANGNNYNIKHFLKVHAYAKTHGSRKQCPWTCNVCYKCLC